MGMRLNLKMAIAARFKTQLAFAREVGLHSIALSKIVNGWREPTPVERRRIAEALDADEGWLFSSVSRIPSPATDPAERSAAKA